MCVKASFVGLLVVVGLSSADAGASEPIRVNYVASDVGGDVTGWVAGQETPAGRVAPGGSFSFVAEGSTATLHLHDALPPGTPIGMSVATAGEAVRRLCVPNGSSLTMGGLADGEPVSVSMSNYDGSCLRLGYQQATAGVVTIWP